MARSLDRIFGYDYASVRRLADDVNEYDSNSRSTDSRCNFQGCSNLATQCLTGVNVYPYKISNVCRTCKKRLDRDRIKDSFKIVTEGNCRLEVTVAIYDKRDLISIYRGRGFCDDSLYQIEFPTIGWVSDYGI